LSEIINPINIYY